MKTSKKSIVAVAAMIVAIHTLSLSAMAYYSGPPSGIYTGGTGGKANFSTQTTANAKKYMNTGSSSSKGTSSSSSKGTSSSSSSGSPGPMESTGLLGTGAGIGIGNIGLGNSSSGSSSGSSFSTNSNGSVSYGHGSGKDSGGNGYGIRGTISSGTVGGSVNSGFSKGTSSSSSSSYKTGTQPNVYYGGTGPIAVNNYYNEIRTNATNSGIKSPSKETISKYVSKNNSGSYSVDTNGIYNEYSKLNKGLSEKDWTEKVAHPSVKNNPVEQPTASTSGWPSLGWEGKESNVSSGSSYGVNSDFDSFRNSWNDSGTNVAIGGNAGKSGSSSNSSSGSNWSYSYGTGSSSSSGAGINASSIGDSVGGAVSSSNSSTSYGSFVPSFEQDGTTQTYSVGTGTSVTNSDGSGYGYGTSRTYHVTAILEGAHENASLEFIVQEAGKPAKKYGKNDYTVEKNSSGDLVYKNKNGDTLYTLIDGCFKDENSITQFTLDKSGNPEVKSSVGQSGGTGWGYTAPISGTLPTPVPEK